MANNFSHFRAGGISFDVGWLFEQLDKSAPMNITCHNSGVQDDIGRTGLGDQRRQLDVAAGMIKETEKQHYIDFEMLLLHDIEHAPNDKSISSWLYTVLRKRFVSIF